MTSQLHFISANSISMGLSGKHINLFKFDQATNIDEVFLHDSHCDLFFIIWYESL